MKKALCTLIFILLSLTAFSGFLDRIKSEIKWKEEEKPIFENVMVFNGKNMVQEIFNIAD